MAAATTETISRVKFELLPHSVYNPDLTPYGYHIFKVLKDVLCGHQFTNNKEVKDPAHKWLHMQLKTFLADSTRKLVD
jgi:hypothetical protein